MVAHRKRGVTPLIKFRYGGEGGGQGVSTRFSTYTGGPLSSLVCAGLGFLHAGSHEL